MYLFSYYVDLWLYHIDVKTSLLVACLLQIKHNGPVYTTCGSWMIQFHNKPSYLPVWPLSYGKNRWTEHVVCTLLETVGTKWVVLARPCAAGQLSLCDGYCVDRVGRLFWISINCIVAMFIIVFNSTRLNYTGQVCRQRWPECEGLMGWPMCDNKVCGPWVWAIYPFYPIVSNGLNKRLF